MNNTIEMEGAWRICCDLEYGTKKRNQCGI